MEIPIPARPVPRVAEAQLQPLVPGQKYLAKTKAPKAGLRSKRVVRHLIFSIQGRTTADLQDVCNRGDAGVAVTVVHAASAGFCDLPMPVPGISSAMQKESRHD
jgi:hypothetical protein